MEGRAGEGSGEASRCWKPNCLENSSALVLKDGVEEAVRRKVLVGRACRAEWIMVEGSWSAQATLSVEPEDGGGRQDRQRGVEQWTRHGKKEPRRKCSQVLLVLQLPATYPCHPCLLSFCCLSRATITVSLQPPDRLLATPPIPHRESAGDGLRRYLRASVDQGGRQKQIQELI